MKKYFVLMLLVALTILPLALIGCKSKVEKAPEEPVLEMPESATPVESTINNTTTSTVEPAQTVATETIPPTAAPQIEAGSNTAVPQVTQNKNKDIQRALKNAGVYTGSIDGKIGPRTKRAIVEFQKSKGLKADGKVGPKTWVELEKYLVQQ